MIKELRKINSNWKAELIGFGYYSYTLTDPLSRKWVVQSYAHFTPRFDGDDDSFTSMWHLYIDNEQPKGYYPTQSKEWTLEQISKIYYEDIYG